MTAGATDLRTFVAVELPAEVKHAIAREQARLQEHLSAQRIPATLRWSAVENIHLTLRFLGDTTATQQGRLVTEMRAAAQGWPPFTLSVAGLGCFPNCRAPRVVWQGVGGDLAALGAIQTEVESLVQQVGFAAEDRPFSPHLTLARARREAARPALQETGRALALLAAQTAPPALSFIVDHLVYFQSELRAGGSVYTPLATIPFAHRPTP